MVLSVAPEARAAKESFITNLPGCSHAELLLVTSLLPHLTLLASVIRCIVVGSSQGPTPRRPTSPLVRNVCAFFLDLGLLVLPMVAVLMEAASAQHTHLMAALLISGLWAVMGDRLAPFKGRPEHTQCAGVQGGDPKGVRTAVAAAHSNGHSSGVKGWSNGPQGAYSISPVPSSGCLAGGEDTSGEGEGSPGPGAGSGPRVIGAPDLKTGATGAATNGEELRIAAMLAAEAQTRFISEYRGGLMLITSICILAVDFQAFPRRYAKAERFGTGLMDIGVGAFVFANGVVKAVAVLRNPHHRIPLARCAATGLLKVATLVILGVGRVVSTQGVNYPQHVGEYGVHWNFFFTLAAVKLMTTLLPLPPSTMLPIGMAVTAAYQAVLSWGGLIHWVHSDDRSGAPLGLRILALNKEGLCSTFGYWGLYLMTVGITMRMLTWMVAGEERQAQAAAAGAANGASRTNGSSRSSTAAPVVSQAPARPWTRLVSWVIARHPPWAAVLCMLLLDAALWLLTWGLSVFVQPVSRRACNAAYVAWMLAYNTVLLTAVRAKQLLLPSAPPGLSVALNYNLLPTFLLANLLTGAVNLSVDTLMVQDTAARAIVSAYLLAVCAPAAVAFSFRKRLRLS